MPVYRYKLSGPFLTDLSLEIPGTATLDDSGSYYVDISADSGDKDDLDASMSTRGYTYVSQDPTDSPIEAASGDQEHDDLAGSGTNTHAQIDSHIGSISNPHSTDVGNLGSGTLAELNVVITDATLDDSSDSRDPNAHALTHESGGSDEIAHQDLAGAGTNTHAQIDSHIGSTSNPHSVDKTDVGLSNVTNDAQLKRAAGDFSSFSQKSSPTVSDRVLIEDQADSGNKKWAAIDDLPGAGTSGKGIEGVVLISSGVNTKYVTITAAMAAATSGDVVRASPGTYAESFTIPNNVTLVGIAEKTIITGSAATGTRITMSPDANLRSVRVELPTNAVPAILYASAGQCFMDEVTLEGKGTSGIGIQVNNASAVAVILHLTYDGGSCDTIVDLQAGRIASAFWTIAPGVSVDTGVFVGNSTELTLSTAGLLVFPGASLSKGFDIEGATVILSGIELQDVTTGVQVSADDHDITIKSSKFVGNTTEVKVASTVTDGKFYASGIQGSIVKLDAPIDWVNNGFVSFQIQDIDPYGAGKFIHAGDSNFGLALRGSRTYMGEGGTYYRGMLAYTYNGSTYTNVTTAASSLTGSTFTIGTGVNNALYVASALENSTDYLQTLGVQISTETAAVGGEIVIEYWNGSSWSEVNGETRSDNTPYLPYAKDYFGRVDTENIRFNLAMTADWTKNDPVSLGLNLFWVRFRVSSTLTTAPVWQSMRLHTDSMEVGEDGFIQFYGRSRPLGRFPWDAGLLEAANLSPDNQPVYLSDNLGVGRVENEFLNNQTDRIGGLFFLPEDLCTACPVRVRWTFFGYFNSGDVVWVIRWAFSKDGDGVFEETAYAPSTATGEQSVEVVTTITDYNEQLMGEAFLDISEAIARRTSGSGDTLWITLERVGSDADDTYTQTVYLMNLEASYSKWSLGGHV